MRQRSRRACSTCSTCSTGGGRRLGSTPTRRPSAAPPSPTPGVAVRDRLCGEHPCSPADPAQLAGLSVPDHDPACRSPDHDPAWRAEVRLEPAASQRLVLRTATDGAVPSDRVGVLRTPWGPLDA